MTNKELISIVVPCYNQAVYLDDALQSVLDQTYTNWECVIVDDGSPDDTEAVAKKWSAKDPRFIYLKKSNGGLSSARNAGVQLAKGKYILPLDSDDRISANYVQECLSQLEQDDKTKIVYGKAIFFGEKEGVWPLPPYDYKLLLTRNLVYCTAMFRKTDWLAAGGYDESMLHGLEDWDFWLRVLNEGDKVVCLDTITFYYRIKERSMIQSLISDRERQNKTYEYLYQKHYAKMNPVIGSPIQLYIEKEELEKHAGRLTEIVETREITLDDIKQKIVRVIRRRLSLRPSEKKMTPSHTIDSAAQQGSKLNLIKNKVKANIGNNQSIKEIVQSAIFYLSRKGFHKAKEIIRFCVRKIYVLVETKHVVILNWKEHSLIYAKDPYNYWRSKHEVTPKDYDTIRQQITIFRSQPLFSVIIFVQTVDETLIRSVRSFNEQVYSARRLFIVASSVATKESVERILEENNPGGSQAVVIVSGELEKNIEHGTKEHFVMHLKQGDTLTADALYWFAHQSLIFPEAGIIYADEDVTDGAGSFYNPQFKPDWSPDNLRSYNYIQRAVVFNINLLQQIETWATKWEAGEDYDITLRVSEQSRVISHLAKLLYHSLEKAESREQAELAYKQSKAALTAAMQRGSETGEIVDSERVKGIFIPRYTLKKEAKVSIIIPTKDKIDILKTCIDSIVQKSTYNHFEIILIDNNSSTPAFFAQVKIWEQQMPDTFKCIRTEEPFNFAFLMNFGAKHCSGDYYVLLNNDTEVITPNWLELLMEQAQRSSIGVVGAKLLYPDNTIQHAGVVMGLSGLVDHVFVGVPRYGKSYQNYIHRVINYSALTAACLMVSKQKFNEVNGFNELFQVEFNDIDFCLRLKEAGYNHVYLPHVELYHHESISRGHPFATPASYERHLREFDLVQKTWQKYIDKDPCYNPNLSLKDRNMSIAY